ncbi:MAG: peptide-methionine (R)-S-oxide reductase MsrB [Proteobacteria bacterium]|nr:peptide-methionine (R)-S-oxide reductase MsrB [Pseudomonadota bacterium]
MAASKVRKSPGEWRRQLTAEQYRITREKGTEPPFSGRFVDHHGDGSYCCVACGLVLFDSSAKYASGSGWPSFTRPVGPDSIGTELDTSLGLRRMEILCSRCDSHLGHVFDDGPQPTGRRYCVNSVSLRFEPRAASKTDCED